MSSSYFTCYVPLMCTLWERVCTKGYAQAGTKQGENLSLALFSLVASFMISPLRALSPKLTIMMYTDDLIIFIEGKADPNILKLVWAVVEQLGHFLSRKGNSAKT